MFLDMGSASQHQVGADDSHAARVAEAAVIDFVTQRGPDRSNGFLFSTKVRNSRGFGSPSSSPARPVAREVAPSAAGREQRLFRVGSGT